MRAVEICRHRADAMVGVQHCLLCFLNVERKASFQCLAFPNHVLNPHNVLLKRSSVPNGAIHLCIELANLAFES